jgi:hypothetical protein
MAKTIDEALALFAAGKSPRECEKLTRFSASTISRKAKERGIIKGIGQSKGRQDIGQQTTLYLITADEFNGIYKIGITNDIDFRLKSMQTGCPFKLIVFRAYTVENPPALEQALHLFFTKKRLRGEWFRLTDIDLAYIDEALLSG